jgi:hypothetical protein
MVHVVSVTDQVPAAMLVAGLAALTVRGGKRVLAAQTSDQPFDVWFALGVLGQIADSSLPIVATPSGVDVLTIPLRGSTPLGLYARREALRAVIQQHLLGCDLVFAHLDLSSIERIRSEVAPPDELVVVASETPPDVQQHAYRIIKQVVAWNAGVRIGLIASGPPPAIGPPLARVREAVDRFLHCDSAVLGRLPVQSGLASSFLSGAMLEIGWEEITRVLGPIANRWIEPPGHGVAEHGRAGSRAGSAAQGVPAPAPSRSTPSSQIPTARRVDG